MIVQRIDLNMIPESAPVVVHANQYDAGTGRIVATLFNGDQVYTPASGATAVIQGTKPDGKGFDYNATISGSEVTADVTEQMTAVDGKTRCQIVITEGDNVTGTFVFYLMVQKSALPADTDMSQSEYSVVMQLLEQAEALNQYTPYIGANGNWWIYSVQAGAYIDTGVDASISIAIADVTMLEPNATPYVTNSGTATDPIFHLFIPRGKGISSIDKTGTSGLVDTYTITYSDGTTTTFTVTNGADGADGADGEDGRSIVSIVLSSRMGLDDTYTIRYSDDTTSTFTVRNGNQWFNGTGVSGKSVTPTVFPSSGVSYAHEQDCYLNTTEGAVYVCVTGGGASVAEWSYQFTMSSGGGGGTGDMLASVYDVNGDVANAGGIPAYTVEISEEIVKDTVGWTGKNLVKKTNSATHNGITFTVNEDNSVTVNGTATATAFWGAPATIEVDDFIMSGCPQNGSSNSYLIDVRNAVGGVSPYSRDYQDTGNGIQFHNDSEQTVYINIRIASGYTANNLVFKPMLRKADITDPTYEPYHETVEQCKFDRAEQRVLGAKNLLSQSFSFSQATVYGITFTILEEGKIKIDGTNDGTAINYFLINNLTPPKGDYILSKGYKNANVKLSADAYNDTTWVKNLATSGVEDEKPLTIDYSGYNRVRFQIIIEKNTVVDNIMVYPMLRLASDPDDTFAPYAMTNRELTESKDSWTDIATVDSNGHVTFTGLNEAYAYSNPFINDNVARVITVARSGSGTNVTLIFALDGATQGDQCKLRIFK